MRTRSIPVKTRTTDTVTLSRGIYERLASLAACWELWWSPAAVAYRADEAERLFRARIRSASWDLAAATAWGNPATVPIGYAELQRRRYPWLHDPAWRSPYERAHGHPYPGGPVDWRTGRPLNARIDHAA
jgi:hypothetical protein